MYWGLLPQWDITEYHAGRPLVCAVAPKSTATVFSCGSGAEGADTQRSQILD